MLTKDQQINELVQKYFNFDQETKKLFLQKIDECEHFWEDSKVKILQDRMWYLEMKLKKSDPYGMNNLYHSDTIASTF